MRVRYVVGAAAAVVTLVLLGTLLKSEPRLASTNSRVFQSKFAVPVPPHQTRCQGGEYVPTDAATLRVYPGAAQNPAGPPLTVSLINDAGRRAATVKVPSGYPVAVPGTEGRPLMIALPAHRQTIQLGQLCIRNDGRRLVTFAGNKTTADPASPGGYNGVGERPSDEVRADYFLAGSHNAFSIAGRVMDRAALLRPGFMGPWTVWLVLLLFLGAGVTSVVWYVRQLEDEA